MDLKQIKELMAAMEKAKIKRLKIKTEKGFEVVLEKEGEEMAHPLPHLHRDPHLHHFPHHSPLPPRHPAGEESLPPQKEREAIEGRFISSPMVGTFYNASSPDESPFVKTGDEIHEESIVCIIEAMKVMNEVKAGVKGRVAEVLIENGNPVEFGTKMIRVI
ncbi:MAG: acetyl-CoA carboxylase, biotin carboxyl carrier protein [Chlamydiae bacterium GWC2_50_10]|nr:MAG: acetyl-CoA carboxylase, biotin carboxyl carrier protein [Chlamydiae bacterium GWA2_50_15]OGN54604.1 MAG: acetyl-CoA carboxylase, biotin carboxyl carrier protein [Chlamydiae bacterium GWC2_50_10]OGN56025.1 MAG: acetyl-CoA carboxylase, biotin carboxyl carrier protein [Chlamydiae bacterium GWF2_49_8]OGN57861.1 MAG: acetyl-CoA carboxylase, biotin carboxyl carrier protein [Chlamydiae bacterium RIFCSPHIGHO2_02_FULL_49_29]OGN63328.1 MAG: acetyl-CoA carboxylase, biotin carboxyl carrier protein 